MTDIQSAYRTIVENLKSKISLARKKAAISVNSEMLHVYWEIGKTVSNEIQSNRWGAKIIETLSKDLKEAFPDLKGLSARTIKYMRAFAEAYPEFGQQVVAQFDIADNQSVVIMQQLVAQLPWSHHTTILDKIPDPQIRKFYIRKSVENQWSRSVLSANIESKLHLRQGKSINNFAVTLPTGQSDLTRETIKSPYIFDFLSIGESMQERQLEEALIAHLKKFLLELGRGFAYVGNQHRLEVKQDEYFLDLLFYNYNLHAFVVFELKVGEFKPEYTGKLNFYINTIDEQIKSKLDNPTIGILLCKTPNETVVKYALKNVDTPIGVAEYEFSNALPEKFESELPTIEELETELQKESEEFKQKQNPVDARWQSIREKLGKLTTEEIKTNLTFPVLTNLYTTHLKGFYHKLVQQLSIFDEYFLHKNLVWNARNYNVTQIEQLDKLWQSDEDLNRRELNFIYVLSAFRKSGADALSVHMQLDLRLDEYSFSFNIVNDNTNGVNVKRLYHQGFPPTEQQFIIDTIKTKIMDRIQEYLDRLDGNSDWL